VRTKTNLQIAESGSKHDDKTRWAGIVLNLTAPNEFAKGFSVHSVKS
jgi:hypothetical protein